LSAKRSFEHPEKSSPDSPAIFGFQVITNDSKERSKSSLIYNQAWNLDAPIELKSSQIRKGKECHSMPK